jgi:hypothetical protein
MLDAAEISNKSCSRFVAKIGLQRPPLDCLRYRVGIRYEAPYWTTGAVTEDCTVSAAFVSTTDGIFRDGFDGTPFARAP